MKEVKDLNTLIKTAGSSSRRASFERSTYECILPALSSLAEIRDCSPSKFYPIAMFPVDKHRRRDYFHICIFLSSFT